MPVDPARREDDERGVAISAAPRRDAQYLQALNSASDFILLAKPFTPNQLLEAIADL